MYCTLIKQIVKQYNIYLISLLIVSYLKMLAPWSNNVRIDNLWLYYDIYKNNFVTKYHENNKLFTF